MQTALIIIGVLALIVAPLAWFFHKQIQELKAPRQDESLQLMMQLINELRRDIDQNHGKNREEIEKKLHNMTVLLQQNQNASTESLQKQFKQSNSIVQEVTKNLTHLQETNKQVMNFAEQMKSLENILKNPKQRGILGEYALEALLANHLHSNYQMQYKVADGDVVDAAIFFNDLIIPIDAKFSLENYNRMVQEEDAIRREEAERAFRADVKKRIDETAKYIQPDKGTTNFAFMFIPAEGVYYNLTIYSVGTGNVNTRNLMEYAFEKKVIIVSPSSFFAYLQTVLQGLNAFEVNENAEQIRQGISVLSKHINAYEEYMQKLGRQLGTTVNTYNSASREFKKIDKDVYRITDGETGGTIESMVLEAPADLEKEA